ncbi:hypothetical protein ACFPN2_25050 [Steroidobacter flavus]|uniref:Sel1 repeat family protein n=1 Tax=Steroidobacter flavus TaxID=1842136 RepID=A0ABV8T001_9GAMM
MSMQQSLILMICSLLLICVSTSSAAETPTPSVAFQEAFASHSFRVRDGRTDPSPFIAELRAIAPTGDAVAQFMLAMLTMLTMNDDRLAAISLLRSSASGGCEGAAGALGVALADSDPAEAKKWIVRAAKNGDTGAQLSLSAAYKNGTLGFPRDIIEAFAWATVAQNHAPTNSMRQVAASAVGTILTEADSSVFSSGQSRVVGLMSEIPKKTFYLCGYSLP